MTLGLGNMGLYFYWFVSGQNIHQIHIFWLIPYGTRTLNWLSPIDQGQCWQHCITSLTQYQAGKQFSNFPFILLLGSK